MRRVFCPLRGQAGCGPKTTVIKAALITHLLDVHPTDPKMIEWLKTQTEGKPQFRKAQAVGGNSSVCVILPRPALALVGIRRGDTIRIRVVDHTLLLDKPPAPDPKELPFKLEDAEVAG